MKNGANISFRQSLECAAQGLAHVFKTERNARIHVATAFGSIILGLVLGLSLIEWALILVAVTLVFVGEMLNTVVERIVDLMILQKHPLAQQAKDVAAGAVLVAAVSSVAIGLLVFGPHLWAILTR